MQKIPFHIISGFLGSGKTTFVRRIIDTHAGNCRLGIVQNEFAPSDIDGKELKMTGREFSLMGINKGSAFCECLLSDFTRSLEKFIDECQPELLLMEASGLSDTTSVAEVLGTGSLASRIYIAANWCVADAVNFSRSGLMRQRVEHQLRMADVILLNKTDMVDDLQQVEAQINKMNPFAEIRRTVYCSTEFNAHVQPLAKFYPMPVQPLGRPDVHSMVIKSSKKLTREQVEAFLLQWAPAALRIKGYVNLKNGRTLAVQCVAGTVEVAEVDGSFYSTELIALSENFTLREWNQSFRSIS